MATSVIAFGLPVTAAGSWVLPFPGLGDTPVYNKSIVVSNNNTYG